MEDNCNNPMFLEVCLNIVDLHRDYGESAKSNWENGNDFPRNGNPPPKPADVMWTLDEFKAIAGPLEEVPRFFGVSLVVKFPSCKGKGKRRSLGCIVACFWKSYSCWFHPPLPRKKKKKNIFCYLVQFVCGIFLFCTRFKFHVRLILTKILFPAHPIHNLVELGQQTPHFCTV